MKTVIIGVRSLDESLTAVRQVWLSGAAEPVARISFATPELLWGTLTARRWAILRAMAGQGPLSVREVARRVGRDVKPVHADIQALLEAGVLDRSARGQAVFPYDSIHVDFTLQAA